MADELADTAGCKPWKAAVFLGPDASADDLISTLNAGGAQSSAISGNFGHIVLYLAEKPSPATRMLIGDCPGFCRRAVGHRLAELPAKLGAARVGS